MTMNNETRGPFFSIVIPTFNRSRLVTFAVESILRQTFGDFEIVVCDNCSADDTPDVVAGIRDPRVRYVRTPEHCVIADSWEFARSQAVGRFVLMLSDDDALVPSALETLAHESRRHDADFLFCGVAEYRDTSFPGEGRNSVSCPPFSGVRRLVPKDEFLRPLFAFKVRFNMHPSAFAFNRVLADRVANRCGRFFQTNGVEYCAWTLAATLAERRVYVDAPLCICGRTGASWGSNIALANPGQERIQQFIADVDHEHKHAPLKNFTMCNLWAEGVLTARKLLAMELGAYDFDEAEYLRGTMAELSRRQSLGVDVTNEMRELREYVGKWPSLARQLASVRGAKPVSWRHRLARVGGPAIRAVRKVVGSSGARKVRNGDVRSGFAVYGDEFGFHTIVECADFVDAIVTRRQVR
jgi:glycosyltransferase involved in cell wall biosynthesis